MKRLVNIFLVSLEYLPSVVTLAFAAYVAALNEVKALSAEILLKWILILIGLIATSELVERTGKMRRIENALSKVQDTVDKEHQRISAEKLFWTDFPDHRPYLKDAKTVSCGGTTQFLFTTKYAATFKKKVQEGCEFRFLVVNPDGPGVITAFKRGGVFSNIEAVRQELMRTLDNLKVLINASKRKHQVQVRLAEYDLAVSMSLINSQQTDGVALIGLYPQKSYWEVMPVFELIRSRDPNWFQFFVDQYDRMWADATSWHPTEPADGIAQQS